MTASVINESYEMIGVDTVTPHPRNPRIGSVEAIVESIGKNDFYGAIVVQRSTGHVLAGNHRLEAARASGLAEVPALWVDCDDERALRILLADNRTNDLAGYDSDGLANLLSGILDDTGTLIGTGYDEDALADLLKELAPPAKDLDADPKIDQAEELRKELGVEPGQIWRLGDHRIICGDSTDADVVARLLAGAEPGMMVTDPPYGIEYDADWRNHAYRADGSTIGASATGAVENDDRADWQEAWELFPGDVAYVWHAGLYAGLVQGSLEAAGLSIRSQIVWAKNVFAISRGDYHWQHEPCWYAVRKGASGDRTDDRKQSTLWEIDKPHKSETGHSTQKPIECMARPIRNHDHSEIYEPFSGSGTTIIACENLGRRCFAVELSPGYVAVAIQRWADATGKAPELLSE